MANRLADVFVKVAAAMTMDNSAKLAGRSILITGAAAGIGRATAELFAAEGATLGLIDRSAADLAAVADRLSAHAYACDLGDPDAAALAVDALAERLGRIDGVVNCAGVGLPAILEETTDEIWNRSIGINLTAPFQICRAALPWLRREASATIVNVASAQGLLPNLPGVSAYAASKAGLIGFTKAMAAEVGPRIRANALCPGLTQTAMAPSDMLDDIVRNYALQRIAETTEMAFALLFLTSSDSSFISGIALAADGGRTFH